MAPIPLNDVDGESPFSPNMPSEQSSNLPGIEGRLKDVIQDLYEIQSSVHGYLGPETQQALISKMYSLLAPTYQIKYTLTSLTFVEHNFQIRLRH